MSESGVTQFWQHVGNNWENEAAHDALLQQCITPEQLAEVARLYRSQVGVEGRTQLAERQLKRITALAMAQLEVKREAAPSRAPLGKVLMIVFFVLASAFLLSLL